MISSWEFEPLGSLALQVVLWLMLQGPVKSTQKKKLLYLIITKYFKVRKITLLSWGI